MSDLHKKVDEAYSLFEALWGIESFDRAYAAYAPFKDDPELSQMFEQKVENWLGGSDVQRVFALVRQIAPAFQGSPICERIISDYQLAERFQTQLQTKQYAAAAKLYCDFVGDENRGNAKLHHLLESVTEDHLGSLEPAQRDKVALAMRPHMEDTFLFQSMISEYLHRETPLDLPETELRHVNDQIEIIHRRLTEGDYLDAAQRALSFHEDFKGSQHADELMDLLGHTLQEYVSTLDDDEAEAARGDFMMLMGNLYSILTREPALDSAQEEDQRLALNRFEERLKQGHLFSAATEYARHMDDYFFHENALQTIRASLEAIVDDDERADAAARMFSIFTETDAADVARQYMQAVSLEEDDPDGERITSVIPISAKEAMAQARRTSQNEPDKEEKRAAVEVAPPEVPSSQKPTEEYEGKVLDPDLLNPDLSDFDERPPDFGTSLTDLFGSVVDVEPGYDDIPVPLRRSTPPAVEESEDRPTPVYESRPPAEDPDVKFTYVDLAPGKRLPDFNDTDPSEPEKKIPGTEPTPLASDPLTSDPDEDHESDIPDVSATPDAPKKRSLPHPPSKRSKSALPIPQSQPPKPKDTQVERESDPEISLGALKKQSMRPRVPESSHVDMESLLSNPSLSSLDDIASQDYVERLAPPALDRLTAPVEVPDESASLFSGAFPENDVDDEVPAQTDGPESDGSTSTEEGFSSSLPSERAIDDYHKPEDTPDSEDDTPAPVPQTDIGTTLHSIRTDADRALFRERRNYRVGIAALAITCTTVAVAGTYFLLKDRIRSNTETTSAEVPEPTVTTAPTSAPITPAPTSRPTVIPEQKETIDLDRRLSEQEDAGPAAAGPEPTEEPAPEPTAALGSPSPETAQKKEPVHDYNAGKVLHLPVSMKLEDLLSRGEKYRGGVAYPTGNDGYLFSLRRGKVEMITTAPCLADGQGVTCMSVVVRHPEDLTVVYGNLNKVEVREGDIVKSGQQIGAVDTDSASPKVTIKASRNGRMIDEAELLTTKSEEAK